MPATRIAYVPSADAIELLVIDHDKIRKLFDDFNRSHAAGLKHEAERIARQVCAELTIHATLEQEIFYPEARAELDDTDLVKQAKVEHAMEQQLIGQIAAGFIDDDKYAAKVRVLRENIERHMREEEDRMFPNMQQSGLEMQEIGARILARKLDLIAELGAGADNRRMGKRRRRSEFGNYASRRAA
ncbi:MAG: hemerythrin [Betaproteobacteria bacterium]|nr:hemerythrin [Betaproteobacteria bacterium]